MFVFQRTSGSLFCIECVYLCIELPNAGEHHVASLMCKKRVISKHIHTYTHSADKMKRISYFANVSISNAHTTSVVFFSIFSSFIAFTSLITIVVFCLGLLHY